MPKLTLLTRPAAALSLLATAGLAVPAAGLDIVLDYSHDSFFASNPTAKFPMDAAAADLSLLITTSLNATVDQNVGQGGTSPFISTATFNHSYNYTNPSTGASETVADASMAADEVRVYVGMRNLGGSVLGQGGPGGAGFSVSTFFYFEDDLNTAIANGNAASNLNMGRGGGPTISNLSGTIGSQPYSIDYGPALGNVWFDSDTDNDGDFDTTTELEASWHFDHTTAVAAGKSDFYSVAVHELQHALGIGLADSWDDNRTGLDWNGAAVNAITSGIGLVDPDLGHINTGTMSTSWVDGASQEVSMDPNILIGTRKHVTELDLAFLADMGWDVNIPGLGDANNDGAVDGDDLIIFASNWGNPGFFSTGDFNRDGVVDVFDLDLMRLNWDGPAASYAGFVIVPEPGTAAVMLGLAVAGLIRRRR